MLDTRITVLPRSLVLHATLLLSVLGSSPVAAQAGKFDLSQITLAPLTPQTGAQPRPPQPPAPATAPPVRLTGAQYLALRPHLASLAGVPAASLAPQPLYSTDLSTVGNTILITPGLKSPNGFSWAAYSVSAFEGKVVTMPGLQSGILFSSLQSAPIGIYLFTVHIQPVDPGGTASMKLTYRMCVGNDFPAESPIALQSGMAVIPLIKSKNGGMDLRMYLTSPNKIVFTGCEIMRVK